MVKFVLAGGVYRCGGCEGLYLFSRFFFFFLSAVKADFFNREQCICVLFIDSQISFLSIFY